ncbi:LysR substrate-binding domain-containing protein, partial [Nostoc sp. NIES-2111]
VSLPRFYRDELVLHQIGSGRRETVSLTPRLRTDSLYAARSAARAGVGAALLSAWLVADDLATGRLCQLVPDWEASPLPVHLAYPYARIYPSRLRKFVEVMRRAMPGIPGMRPPSPR